MFLTICQACHKGKKLSANNKMEYCRFFIYCVDFQIVILDNIAHYVTDEDYEAGESQGIEPDIDDFTPIQHRKNQTTIGKHSHRILVTIPFLQAIITPDFKPKSVSQRLSSGANHPENLILNYSHL